jgi:plastocyanin
LKSKPWQSKLGGIWLFVFIGSFAFPQEVTFTARVALVNGEGAREPQPHGASNVVLWLMPASGSLRPASVWSRQSSARLVQKNKSFDPHVMVVPVGSVVAFPNHDPFFHNVFSLFEGKRFDLGLYEAGTSKDVHFDKPGISYIFCNIHPEMSAVVITVDTAYYGISDARGQVVIPKVPTGRYTLRVWNEAALPETLQALVQEINISENSSSLGVLRVTEAALPMGHKNLYGRDYDPPTPNDPAYVRH